MVDVQQVSERPSGPTGIPGYLEERRLVLPDGLPFDEWQRCGQILFYLERNVSWWIGDWWRYGERAYGEMATQASKDEVEDMTGCSYKTTLNSAWVASKFEPSRRRESLSFSHHAEVAALEPEEADEWLDQAETQGWSRGELRGRVRRAERGDHTLAFPYHELERMQRHMAECDARETAEHYREMESSQHVSAAATVREMIAWLNDVDRSMREHGD